MQFLIDVGRSQIPNFTCALISSIWDVLFYQWVIQAVFSAWLGGAGIGNQGKFLLLPTESMRCLCWEPSQKFRIHSHRERRFHQGDVTLQKFPTLIFSIYNTPCSSLRSQVSLIKDNFIPKMNFWWHQGSKNYSAVMCNEKNHSLNCILSHSSATSAIFIYIFMYFQE